MLLTNKNKISNVILFLFLIFWVNFWLRSFQRNFLNHLEETRKLCGKPLEEKWKYVFGDDLYRLISKSKSLIPPNEKIYFIHNLDTPKWSLVSYFLYPREMAQEGNFIVVYKQPFNKGEDGKIIYRQDTDIFIIKR